MKSGVFIWMIGSFRNEGKFAQERTDVKIHMIEQQIDDFRFFDRSDQYHALTEAISDACFHMRRIARRKQQDDNIGIFDGLHLGFGNLGDAIIHLPIDQSLGKLLHLVFDGLTCQQIGATLNIRIRRMSKLLQIARQLLDLRLIFPW